MMKKNFSIQKWFMDNRIYLAAFFLPVLSMLIVYFFKDVYPFGPEMYLRSDNYHQYTPYLQILQDKLSEGGSLFYTWEIGAGMNFIAIAAYYLSSPLNLLLILFHGKVVDIVSFFIVVKMGLSGFSATYYLSKRFGKKDMITVIFGMAYALSAYFAAFSWNIMWLDCMVLLPFIILGLDRLVNEGKCVMYCVSLALAIFSNYYIGIMLCIYSVIYFIYLICMSETPEGVKKVSHYFHICKNYVIYSVLAGGIAASVILPEYYNMLTTRSADTTFPESLERYFSILYMLFRSLIYIPVADLKYPHDPNIYCSVAVFLLIPLYMMCKNIRPKERVGKTILMIIMLISFSFNIPNYIWHGFHFPNSLPCRESFIYIFLVITMAYEAAIHIKEFSSKQILGTFAGAAGLILILEELFKDAEFFSDLAIETSLLKIIYYSLIALIIYTAIIFLYRNKKDIRGFAVYLLVLASFCELTLNMNTTGLVSTSNRKAYYESNEAFDALNKIAAEDASSEGVNFYRTEEVSHRTRNDGALFGYNSISTFSSVSSAAMQYLYDDLGMQTSFNAYSYYGHTPLTSSLFSIKYEYTTSEPSLPSTSSFLNSTTYLDGSNNTVNLNLYKNNYTLPLGFMINSSAMSSWNLDSGNPFDVQNSFVKAAVPGSGSIFHRLSTDGGSNIQTQYALDADDTYTSTGDQMLDVYFYVPTSAENLTATITSEDGTTSTKSYSSTNQNYICHIGEVTVGSTISVTANDGSTVSGIFAYAFDLNAFTSVYNTLSAQGFTVDTFKDTYIKGTIRANNSGLMYTSIPYDEGWKIFVDGVETKATKICKDALTGVFVSAGEHTIEFKYTPKGFVPGILFTIVCILILLALIFNKQILTLIHDKKFPKVNTDKK